MEPVKRERELKFVKALNSPKRSSFKKILYFMEAVYVKVIKKENSTN